MKPFNKDTLILYANDLTIPYSEMLSLILAVDTADLIRSETLTIVDGPHLLLCLNSSPRVSGVKVRASDKEL